MLFTASFVLAFVVGVEIKTCRRRRRRRQLSRSVNTSAQQQRGAKDKNGSAKLK